MKIKSTITSALLIGATVIGISTTVSIKQVKADDYCSSGTFKCGYGQNWTCCNNGDKCCSYTGTDDRTWYTCKLPYQSCTD